MPYGAVTEQWDVALLVLYAFWIFFAGLLFYLRREDRREGFPLVSDVTGKTEPVHDNFWVPEPKTFVSQQGHVTTTGRPDNRPVNATSFEGFPGSPLVPNGNPLVDGIGPAAYAERSDEPDMTLDGELKVVPLRKAREFSIPEEDPDLLGLAVFAADRVEVGKVSDLWVDRSDHVLRYVEVMLHSGPVVLVPIGFVDIKSKQGRIEVEAIFSSQFQSVPVTKAPDRITLLEEDKISGYFAGGSIYAAPMRAEPLL